MSTAGAGREGSAPVLAADVPTRQSVRGRARRTRPQHVAASAYPHWFYLPAGIVFGADLRRPDAARRSTSA